MEKTVVSKMRWTSRPQLLAVAVAVCLLGLGVVPVGHGRLLHRAELPVLPGSSSLPTQSVQTVLPLSTRVDCAKTPCLNLSFDDGPNPITTPQILTILEQNHVHANFFVVGLRAAAMLGILQREYRDGDEIGNHSWSHPDLTTLTPTQVQAQVSQTQAAVVAAGVPAPRLFRPPYGAINAMVKSQIHLTLAMWSVDPEDWNTSDPGQLAQKVINEAKPGGVVDMHDIDSATVTALPAILQNLKSRFQLVTMSQLFNLAPGEQGEFFGR